MRRPWLEETVFSILRVPGLNNRVRLLFSFFSRLGTARLPSLMRAEPEQCTSHWKLCQEIVPRTPGALRLSITAKGGLSVWRPIRSL